MPAAGPRSLLTRLRKRQRKVKRASAASGSRPERCEGRVALERLGERHARRGAEVVAVEAAQTAKEGEEGECSERACGAAVTHGRVGSRWQGSRLERREGRVALEDLGERHATLGAELVVAEAAHAAKEGEKGKRSERACCCGRDAWAGGFDGRAAD
eukprot:scaffold3797_cov55-Phaeocystis_antarctica.AAC.1